jgi:hypothetical protein
MNHAQRKHFFGRYRNQTVLLSEVRDAYARATGGPADKAVRDFQARYTNTVWDAHGVQHKRAGPLGLRLVFPDVTWVEAAEEESSSLSFSFNNDDDDAESSDVDSDELRAVVRRARHTRTSGEKDDDESSGAVVAQVRAAMKRPRALLEDDDDLPLAPPRKRERTVPDDDPALAARIYVNGLTPNTPANVAKLETFFAAFGTVLGVALPRDKPYGFVQFAQPRDAAAAIAQTKRVLLDDVQRITAKKAYAGQGMEALPVPAPALTPVAHAQLVCLNPAALAYAQQVADASGWTGGVLVTTLAALHTSTTPRVLVARGNRTCDLYVRVPGLASYAVCPNVSATEIMRVMHE